jgi:hypothetical protein
VEPGLFEWLGWYPESLPDWLTYEELQEAGFRINPNYKKIVTKEELQDNRESCEEFYLRSFYLTQNVIKETAEKGETFENLSTILDKVQRGLTFMNRDENPRQSHAKPKIFFWIIYGCVLLSLVLVLSIHHKIYVVIRQCLR